MHDWTAHSLRYANDWPLNMMRIRDGKVVEEWEVFDEMLFMKQLGKAG